MWVGKKTVLYWKRNCVSLTWLCSVCITRTPLWGFLALLCNSWFIQLLDKGAKKPHWSTWAIQILGNWVKLSHDFSSRHLCTWLGGMLSLKGSTVLFCFFSYVCKHQRCPRLDTMLQLKHSKPQLVLPPSMSWMSCIKRFCQLQIAFAFLWWFYVVGWFWGFFIYQNAWIPFSSATV